ncbi:hypothetical protein GCM10022247_08360 [Allokutzneria multivorans]|uniref:Uncharacterized protein n=1 Tax=Allokutzneria multivorans TaxID=1142134 RepID=A0ABP7R2W6_9PSEU
MRRRFSAALAAVAAIAALGLANTASAAAGEAQGAKFPCGYYTNWADWSYYGHCGSGWVKIEVKKLIASNYILCVGPGTTHLGAEPWTTGAVYIGQSCAKPR